MRPERAAFLVVTQHIRDRVFRCSGVQVFRCSWDFDFVFHNKVATFTLKTTTAMNSSCKIILKSANGYLVGAV